MSKVFSRADVSGVVTKVWGRHLSRPRLDVRLHATSESQGDSVKSKKRWVPDPDDAPLYIDPPHGYSHGDDLETALRRIDEHERISWWVPEQGSSLVPNGEFAWPPPLGRGWVARFARAAWALVALLGGVRAAWRCFSVVLFLAPDSTAVGTLTASALDAALRESLAGLAQGALVSMVLAPTAASLLAWLFEISLRVSERLAAPKLVRTMAPATAKTDVEHALRATEAAAGQRKHHAFALLKTAAHDACEARQTAAQRALQAWTHPAVAVALIGAGVAVAGSVTDTAMRIMALRFEAAAFACVAAGMAMLRRVDGAAVKAVRDELHTREKEFLADQHRGTFSCRWRYDDYTAPGERNQTSRDKALTNAAVAAAAAASAAWRGVPPSAAPALVLDAADGRTSAALGAAMALGWEDRRARRRIHRRRWFRGGFKSVWEEPLASEAADGSVLATVSSSYQRAREVSDAFPDVDDASASFDEAAEDDADFADDPSVSFEQSTDGRDRDTREEGLVGFGFPSDAIFVPNQHTHVVHTLRESETKKNTPVAADIRDVLSRRDPVAPPFHLVYLDHCGAVAQREQQIWDVFSRHAVADGGVMAVTFSTRGKRKGWSKATAVAACARMLVEAADAHGYELRGSATDGGGCGSESEADLSRLMDYAVRVRGDERKEDIGDTNNQTGSLSDTRNTGPVAVMERAQRAHAVSIETALAAYLRACDTLGGVECAFGAQVDDISLAADKAHALATALNHWAVDTPSSEDGRAAMLDTWAMRRRRRMCGYVYSRVVLGKDMDDDQNLKDIKDGEKGSTVALSEVFAPSATGDTQSTLLVSPADAKTLASLGREAAKAAHAAADLATAPLTTAGDLGTNLEHENSNGELRFERCFFLYGTLMFFVLRVRVKDRRRIAY